MVDRKTEADKPEYVPVETRTEEKKRITTEKVSPELTDLDRERIMTEATPEAAAARAAMASRETTMTKSEADREKARAMATGAAMGTAASRTSPDVGERTTRAGAAVDTETTTRRVVTERPVTGTVVPPGVTTTTPLKPYGTVDDRARMHAEDPSIHPDWETQPQINAPQDVGIPTAEGQADAARIRAGQRRSNVAEEPRIDRRGGEYEVPAASSAREGGVTGAVKETARDVKEKAKGTARDVKEDVDRKI